MRFNQILNFLKRIKDSGKQFKNLSFYLLASLITSLLGILINPFLAANLSPYDYAIIGYFTSFNLLILPIISFSLLSYYSRNYFLIKEEERQKVLDTLLLSQLFIGLFGLLIVLIGFYFYMQIANVSFAFYPFAILSFVPTFFGCFYNFLLVEKRMTKQAFSYFKIVLIQALLGSLFAILFVVILKKGANGRLLGIMIPMVGIGIVCFFKLISSFQFNLKVFKDAINFGWPLSLSAVLYYFLTGVDRAMLEKLDDNYTFGIYNVAVQISAYLYIFYTSISQTFEPDIYKSISENNRKKLLKIVIGIVVLNAIPTLIFIIFAKPVVNILTFGRYTESTVYAQILAVKNIPMAFCFLFSNIIIGFGYPKVELINRTIGALISVLMFKILIEKFGFYGAAWGQSFAFILMTIISMFFLIFGIYLKKGN
jgi:O-antigen/teichoic acid export membrane protein